MSLKRQAVVSQLDNVCQAIEAIARDEDGVAAIEYALLATLIVVVAAVGIGNLGNVVEKMWDVISVAVSDAVKL